ncbi:response regulator transcription factor [Actinoplanes sp. NBC_00393]|uniref:response regulator transcription factor n=1 Tax=Actinoplanes sp. NBC_00393 TaxID=2975953 RepID=UPI002E1E265D
MTAPVRVVLADDHDLVRGGLAAILTAAGIDVVGETSDGHGAVALARRQHPDVVLMDVEMPGGDGLTATAAITTELPGTRVLVLTMFDLDEYVFQALRSGAAGFLLKTTAPDRLVAAVRACAAGETLLAPSVLRRLVETFVQRPPPPPAGRLPAVMRHLTPREADILRAVARGLSNAEIGAELHLAEPTVKTHITRILAKLGLRDRVQAVVMAYETGLVPR